MRKFSDTDNSASRFKQRVRLERPSITQDSIGDTLITWVLVDEVWADIKPVSGVEELRHAALRQRITHLVWLRYRSDLQPDWRIVYNNRKLQIHAVVNVQEENELSKLWVEEI